MVADGRYPLYLELHLFGEPDIVGVEEGQVAPPRLLNGHIHGGRRAPASLKRDDTHPRVIDCMQPLLRVVRRAVVHDDELQVCVGLSEDALYCLPHHITHVVGGDYDGEMG